MTKVFQHSLFNAGKNTSSAVISWDGHTSWWYVERFHKKSECLYADDQGRFFWEEKNLSFVVPVVCNTRQEAARIARNQKGRIKKYPYRLLKK